VARRDVPLRRGRTKTFFSPVLRREEREQSQGRELPALGLGDVVHAVHPHLDHAAQQLVHLRDRPREARWKGTEEEEGGTDKVALKDRVEKVGEEKKEKERVRVRRGRRRSMNQEQNGTKING